MEIHKIEDIQFLVRNGFSEWEDFGFVSTKTRSGLILFNYKTSAQFEARWNYFEQVSRGLILNTQTGEIVSRPFDKFFNWSEGGRKSFSKIKTITEKMDGSLGILYREGNIFRIATRGSFESEQAIWGTDFLQQNFDLSKLPEEVTLLFEIIYPENRIVVNYQGLRDLILIGGRNRITGKHLAWQEVESISDTFGFSLPTLYQFETPEQILKNLQKLPADSEGWVVEFEDGQRFKFKGQEYLKVHKLISGLSFKSILKSMADGSIDRLRDSIPDEFMGEVNGWVKDIQRDVDFVKHEVEEAFSKTPKTCRKEFALWVMNHHKPLASYMFAVLDSKPIEQMVYKIMLKNLTS